MLKSKKSQINSLSKLNIKELQKNEINIIIISIIYNIFVLSYILNLEKQDCHCFRDWRHNFMKYYSILLIIWSILNITFNLYNNKNELVNYAEELGDLNWYLAVLCDSLNIDFNELLNK